MVQCGVPAVINPSPRESRNCQIHPRAVFPQHSYPHPRETRGFRRIPAVPIPVHTSTVRDSRENNSGAVRRYLSGSQGRPPSPYFDPLDHLLASAHERGIEVHAWLNPYRANMRPDWQGLAPCHIANRHRHHAHPYDRYLWMDPGAQVVADWLVAVVTDIITRSDLTHER